jgi:hypothetical protein
MAKVSPERKKLFALLGLGGIMLMTLVYQLYFSNPAPRPTLQANKNSSTAGAKSTVPVQNPDTAEKIAARQTAGKNDQEEILLALIEDTTPLTYVRYSKGSDAVSERGNIFDYYVEPPKPPPPPPPPPPITLLGVSPQSATAGTPRPFTLTVVGKDIPADAKIYMDGRERQTKRLNDTTLTTEMKPADYPSQKNMTVEVKSTSDAKLFSNQLTFIAMAAPEPPFKFIGLLGDQALFEMTGIKEYLRLRVGGTIQGVWRIDAISNQAVEVTQTQFDIKKRVPLQDKGR